MAKTILLRLPEVISRTGDSRSSIYKKIQQNEFPPPIKIGPRSSAWIEDEVEAWIQKRIKKSRKALIRSSPESIFLMDESDES